MKLPLFWRKAWLTRAPADEVCNSATMAQLVERRAVMREVVSSTPAGPTLRVFK